jgi:rRNA maturation protein Nop10
MNSLRRKKINYLHPYNILDIAWDDGIKIHIMHPARFSRINTVSTTQIWRMR